MCAVWNGFEGKDFELQCDSVDASRRLLSILKAAQRVVLHLQIFCCSFCLLGDCLLLRSAPYALYRIPQACQYLLISEG